MGDQRRSRREVAKDMFDILTTKEDVKGGTTLEGVVKGGQKEYLIVSAWLSVGNFSVPLPEGVKVQNGQVRAVFSGRFPLKATRESLGESAKMIMWFTAIGPPDPRMPEMTFQGAMERSVTSQIEHLQ